MANVVLDIVEMKDNFFANAVMIGIAAVEPAYRFCWLLNKHFDTNFVNIPENTIRMNAKAGSKETVNYISDTVQGFAFPEAENEEEFFFPTYTHLVPNSSHKYMLYQLKCGKKPLIPEIKHLDFLWLIQTAEPKNDSQLIMEELRKIPEIQMAQEIKADSLKKSIANLLV